jgi:solute:Na+ symporter, SSS family
MARWCSAVYCILWWLNAALAPAQVPTLNSFPGRTPVIDGILSAGEWSDASGFAGVRDWVHTFSPTTDPKDLSLKGFVKHDATHLYFAFDVTDDLLYGVDTERWLPKENPQAHELSPRGFPWFGDEMEILLNSRNRWKATESVNGDGGSWQMVCNVTKSRLGGVGKGGLLEGEPRSQPEAFARYRSWIESRAQHCAVQIKPDRKGYWLEWAIRFDPCLEIEPGKFYRPELGEVEVGINIALGDLDRPEDGWGNFGNFHHEDWFSGTPKGRTELRHFGKLRLRSRK